MNIKTKKHQSQDNYQERLDSGFQINTSLVLGKPAYELNPQAKRKFRDSHLHFQWRINDNPLASQAVYSRL